MICLTRYRPVCIVASSITAEKKMNTKPNLAVAVFGATGHTGRFVVEELLRRGLAPVAVGRDAVKLAAAGFEARGVATRCASVDDAASVEQALEGVAAVVNCAGPFLDTARPLAAAAVRLGVHYLDVTAEQPSTRDTLERFDAPARAAKVFVLPAMGFYGGFGDLLATAAMGDWDAADDIEVRIALDSWHPTEGTRITGARNTAPRVIIANGALAPLPQPAGEVTLDYPQPFGRQAAVEIPFSEVILMARHLRTGQQHTYLNLASLRDIRDPATPPPKAADGSGRSAQLFVVEAIVRKGGHTRTATAAGRDIYAFSAPFICEAVSRILHGDVQGGGACAPGEVFDARSYLGALAPELACSFDVAAGAGMSKTA
jgi:hypothetical protein